MFQQVYCSPELLAQLYNSLPSRKIQLKHQGLKEGDEVVFQYDAATYRIKVGERKLFPTEVARAIVKQSTYGLAELAAEPLSFCELIGEVNQGATNPLACPVSGCKYQAVDIERLGKHMLAKHVAAKTQNATVGQGVANRQPESEHAHPAESREDT